MDKCASFGSGTSWSAPIVAGAVALMMEKNRNLSWRDVQHLLVRSAERIDVGHASWARNGAGYFYSDHYGFGLLDVSRAVDFAGLWMPVAPEAAVLVVARIESPMLILGHEEVTRTIVLVTEEMSNSIALVENLELTLDIQNDEFGSSAPGVYQIALTSPSGSTSVISRPRAHLGASSDLPLRDFRFLSRAHWGEQPVGNWILEITYDPRKVIDLCAIGARQRGQETDSCQPNPLSSFFWLSILIREIYSAFRVVLQITHRGIFLNGISPSTAQLRSLV